MIIAQNDKLNEIIKKNEAKIKQNADKKDDEDTKNDEVIPNHLKHLSPTLISKIRAKQENNTYDKKLNNKLNNKLNDKLTENKRDKKYRYQQLPYLVNLIRGIYVSLKKSSMSCNDLIYLIKKRHRNHHIFNEEIWKQLQLLNKLKSNFFKIKQGPMIKVAKLNKKVATKEVLDEINKRLK